MNCDRKTLTRLCSAPIPDPETGLYAPSAYPLYSQYKTDPVLLMESAGLFNQWQLITTVRTQFNRRFSLNGFYMYGRAYSNTDGVGTLPSNPYSMAGRIRTFRARSTQPRVDRR